MKYFSYCLSDQIDDRKHIIAANEGNAIAIAAGYHLATNKIPMVYMQNSGLGNAINPLLSLCDPDVYSIPMLLMIGWRGQPGLKDEPQHIKQGKIQIGLLEKLNLSYEIISAEGDSYETKIIQLIKYAKVLNSPVVLLVEKGSFAKYEKEKIINYNSGMVREKALDIILKELDSECIIISTTGKTSREIFELREKNNESHEKDFLTVGSMGHCSSIAFGIALSKLNQQVICIDGDGAILMHMGSLATIASHRLTNFKHILLNNGVHESVGGQETAAKYINISNTIKALGYKNIFIADNYKELKENITKLIECVGPAFLEIKINPGSRPDLGRPTNLPIENKVLFQKFLESL